jgi:hypothetical protein
MSNETKQTAVEWYAEKSIILFDNLRSGKITFKIWFKEQALLLEQAKEMDKEQHKKTYNQSFMSNFQTFEDYYNETYGGNK